MKLTELKDSIEFAMKHHPSDAEVVVSIDNERAVGARPFVNVSSAMVGIDWEANQFRIEPSEPVAKLGHTKDDQMTAWHNVYRYPNGKETHVYKCPMCEEQLKPRYKYCTMCGQRVVFDKTKVNRFVEVK